MQVEMRPGSTSRLLVIIAPLLLLAACVFYGALWPKAPYATMDTPTYADLAKDLRQLHLTRLHMRTPGLPVLMILTGADRAETRAFYYASLFLHFAAVGILTYLLSVLRINSKTLGLFFCAGMLPVFVAPAAYISTENLSEFLVVVCIAGLMFWTMTARFVFLGAFLLGGIGAALTRPTFQLLPVALAVCVLICHRTGIVRMPYRRLIGGLAGAVVAHMTILVGYSVLNYRLFDYFGVSSMAAYGLSTKVPGVLEAIPERYGPVREILLRHRNRMLVDPGLDHTGQNFIYRALPELIAYHGGNRTAALKEIQSLSMYLIRTRPMSYLNECTKAMAGYWMPTDEPLVIGQSALRRVFWDAIQMALIGIFFVEAIALVGHFLFRVPIFAATKFSGLSAEDPRLGFFILGHCVVWVTMLVSCFAAIGLSRYRAPTELILMAVSIAGFQIWRDGLWSAAPSEVGSGGSVRQPVTQAV
jgi:hypothetical protein